MCSSILGLQQLLTASALSNLLMRYLISQSVSQSLNKIQFPLVNPRHRVFSDVKFTKLLRFKQAPMLPKNPLIHSYKYGG